MGWFPSVGTRVNWGLDARTKAQIKIVANEKTMEDFHVERETLRQQVKGLEANLRKKDDLLSSQDDTRCFAFQVYLANVDFLPLGRCP